MPQVFATPKSPQTDEKSLRNRVQGAFQKRGTFFWSISDSLIKGLPDIQGVWNGKAFFIEFKAVIGVLAPLQLYWLRQLAANQAGAFEVRAEVDGMAPWFAKYRRMGYDGVWLSDYKTITAPDWLEKELNG